MKDIAKTSYSFHSSVGVKIGKYQNLIHSFQSHVFCREIKDKTSIELQHEPVNFSSVSSYEFLDNLGYLQSIAPDEVFLSTRQVILKDNNIKRY